MVVAVAMFRANARATHKTLMKWPMSVGRGCGAVLGAMSELLSTPPLSTPLDPPTSTSLSHIGRCVVCSKSTKLEGHGCAACIRQFGTAFIGIAIRVRTDERFRRLCRRAIAPEYKRMFELYFGTA